MSGKKKKTLLLLTMVLPGAIWFLLLRYLPMVGIVLAFKDYKVYTKDPTFWSTTRNGIGFGVPNLLSTSSLVLK